MKEFRLRAFALKKITMLSATSPTFFSFKTVKKRLKLRWGMILNLKKKSADKRPNQDKGFKKKV